MSLRTVQRRPRRAVPMIAGMISAVILLVSGGAYGYVSYLNSKITTFGSLCVRKSACGATKPAAVNGAVNFLLVGVDNRNGANGEGDLAGLKDATTGGNRSDTTLLVHISKGGKRVDVLSFPRDLYVTIPTFTTKTGRSSGGDKTKFNTAFARGYDNDPNGGGPRLLTQMIQEDFGLRVDHYVQIDFSGFEKMVAALGTVQICLTKDAYDPTYTGFKLSKGVHNVGPQLALQFVRQRHNLDGGDLTRINRQQRFLAAILRKAQSAGTLTNPIKLNNFLTALLGAVTVDSGTHLQDLETLGKGLHGLSSSGVHYFTVPVSGNITDQYGGADQAIDETKLAPLLDAFQHDEDPTVATAAKPAAKPSPVVPADPSTVTVSTVLNASGVKGAAATAKATLTAAGVTVTATGNTASVGGGTAVRYGTGAESQAAAVQKLLAGSHVQADSSLAAGTVAVTIGSTAAATTSTAGSSPSAARPTTTTNFAANGTLCGL